MLFPASTLVAQHQDAPHVKISVHDAAGTPIPDAAIAISPQTLALHTGQDGTTTFDFSREPARMSISAPGYTAKTMELDLFSTIDVALTPSGSGAHPVPSQTDPAAGGDTLTIISAESQSLRASDLAKFPHQSLAVQNGHTHQSETYSGVPLIELLGKAGAPAGSDVKGKALSEYIIATGSDGYKAVLSLAEIEPDFHSGTVLVADGVSGKPLDAKEGPFKLVVSEDRRPARSVHNLVSLELKQAQ